MPSIFRVDTAALYGEESLPSFIYTAKCMILHLNRVLHKQWDSEEWKDAVASRQIGREEENAHRSMCILPKQKFAHS